MFISEFIKHLEEKQIPVFFNACGTGPAWSPYVRTKLADALQSPVVKYLSTRDNKELIQSRYMKNSEISIYTVSDPALWCNEVYGIEKDNDSNVLGLGLMYATSLNVKTETKFWKKIVKYLNKRKIKWQFFINGSAEDLVYANYILSQLDGEEINKDIAVPNIPVDLIKIISGYKSIISFRLHSHIVATSLGIPGVAIVWDEKLQFFYKMMKHPERCKTIYDSPKEIWKALELAQGQGIDLNNVLEKRKISEDFLIQSIEREISGTCAPVHYSYK
ncbi:hypothetical protein P261_01231 [Lachnospiraceae bacterium TWA4]|nr:hypothetical protein P261_01231 [Lachnospiraceae bacterium TWA4]